MKNLLYKIKANTPKEEIIQQLKEHPEIKFVSLVGIDLAGNDTDEKIPVRLFLKAHDKAEKEQRHHAERPSDGRLGPGRRG